MNKYPLEQVNRFLLQKQHLADEFKIKNIIQITIDVAGLHATGIQEPYIALFTRTKHFTREQLDTELYKKRTLGKIRCMRGTLYILPKELIPVAFSATKTMVEKLSLRFAEFRGISPSLYNHISSLVLKILQNREMTISQIKKELDISPNLSALLNLMCDRGLLVRIQSAKDWKSRNYRYAVFTEYLPDANLTTFTESEAMTLLVKQYLGSFGPMVLEDIVWWIGTNKSSVLQAIKNITDEVTQIQIDYLQGEFLLLHSDLKKIGNLYTTTKYVVNLLPALDPYLMGYKKRERYLNQEYYDRIFDPSGNVTSTILINGMIKGVWDFSGDDSQTMKLYFFEKIEDEVLELIFKKAGELGKFLSGKDTPIKMAPTMKSLKERTAGGFMSPLREK